MALRTPVFYGMIDRSGEQTGTQVYLTDLADDGGNFDTVLTNATTGDYDVVKAAIITLTDCNMTRSIASLVVDQSVGTVPSVWSAQRELAVRFTYQDETTLKKYSFTIPGPNSDITQEGTDVIDLSGNIIVAAAVTVFEAKLRSPDGNNITILAAKLIGRNS
jgi:hypothetical protein